MAGCTLDTGGAPTPDSAEPPDPGGSASAGEGEGEPSPGQGEGEGEPAPAVVWTEDSFEDFVDGALAGGGADLLIAAGGTIRPIRSADVDGDGWADVVVPQSTDGETAVLDSRVWFGGDDGFDEARTLDLPTTGAKSYLVADLDDDGRQDLVFVNQRAGLGASRIDSVIYWGGEGARGGFDPVRGRQGLPTIGAFDVASADLNKDGWLDLVFANHDDFDVYLLPSPIYWGGPDGFDRDVKSELGTAAAGEVQIADLDGDGWLDLVLANQLVGNGPTDVLTDSFIYWGGDDGYKADRRRGLPTDGAEGMAIADIDGDGALDIVFANGGQWKDNHRNSEIWWGDGSRDFDRRRLSGIPTIGACDVAVGDPNGDGALDLLFTQHYDSNPDGTIFHDLISPLVLGPIRPDTVDVTSTLYATRAATGGFIEDMDGDGRQDVVIFNQHLLGDWEQDVAIHRAGSAEDVIRIPGTAPTGHGVRSTGDVFGRSGEYTYVSSPWQAVGVSADIQPILKWAGRTPAHTSLAVRVRSAATDIELPAAQWQPWQAASGAAQAAAATDDAWWQYEAKLVRTRPVPGPHLDSISLEFAGP